MLGLTFPYELTDPDNIPDNQDEVYFPVPRTHMPARKRYKLVQEALSNVTNIIRSNSSESDCTKCKNALAAAKPAALHAPGLVPNAMISLCKDFRFHANETCEEDFASNTFGAIWTQVLAYADVEGLDGQYICHSLSEKFCNAPTTSPLDTTKLFPKPKPADVQVPKASGERIKVLHLSDFHLDARYAVSSEANCSSSLCCRSDNYNDLSEQSPLLSASAYGSFLCDTPYDLGLAALQAVGPRLELARGNMMITSHGRSIRVILYRMIRHPRYPRRSPCIRRPAFTACSNIISLVLSLLHLEIMTPVLQTSILLITSLAVWGNSKAGITNTWLDCGAMKDGLVVRPLMKRALIMAVTLSRHTTDYASLPSTLVCCYQLIWELFTHSHRLVVSAQRAEFHQHH